MNNRYTKEKVNPQKRYNNFKKELLERYRIKKQVEEKLLTDKFQSVVINFLRKELNIEQ